MDEACVTAAMKHWTIGIESRDLAAIIILIVVNVMNEAGVSFESGLSRDGEVGMPGQWIQPLLENKEIPMR